MLIDSNAKDQDEKTGAGNGDPAAQVDAARETLSKPAPAVDQPWDQALDQASALASPQADRGAVAGARPRHKVRRGLWLALLLLALIGAGVPMILDMMISVSAGGAVANQVERVEPKPVALLLGTARRTVQGRPNQFYRARIESAAELFHSGKVRGILVSGDNATRFYNEPVAMQKDLVALGVPAEYITLDYAGFRTLDSVVRAKQVFGVEQVIIVSQRFHAERAVFLARHFGLDAKGLAAADPPDPGLMKVRAREVLARLVAVVDIIIGRQPKFLGAPETVRLREATVPQQTACANGQTAPSTPMA
jgi:SanA protein